MENHSSRGKKGIGGVLEFENAENQWRESRESRTERYDLGVSWCWRQSAHSR